MWLSDVSPTGVVAPPSRNFPRMLKPEVQYHKQIFHSDLGYRGCFDDDDDDIKNLLMHF